ncbi:MAG: tetratricopeptide repeat-containing sulfotransferase family protein [Microcoleaceae cyanobacterium]
MNLNSDTIAPDLLENIIPTVSTIAQQCVNIGQALQASNKITEAIIYYQRAIAIDPLWAIAHEQLHNLSVSLPVLDSKQANHYCQLGDQLLEAKQIQEAEQAYHTAILYHPQHPWAYIKLGEIYLQLQQWQQAVNALKIGILYNPDFPWSYSKLGDASSQLSDWQTAQLAYEKSINLLPDFPWHYQKLANCYEKLGNVQGAIALYEQAITKQTNLPSIYVNLANLYLEKGDETQAINYYLQIIEKKPDYPEPYKKLRGIYNYQLVNITPALTEKLIKTYEKVLANQPGIIDARINLANILTSQGKIDLAINHYQQALNQKLTNNFPNLVKNISGNITENQPNFLIIGAAKSGTSSLYEYLSKHPQIVPSLHKEINFFHQKFHLGLPWYYAHFADLSKFANLLTGEASADYLYHPEACQRIYNFLPKVKLITILRNPIDRGISHYYMAKKNGEEKRDLATVIQAEIAVLRNLPKDFDNIASQLKTGFSYFQSGLYIYFLAPWLAKFGQDRLLILDYEDLKNHPANTMGKIYQFLGIPDHPLAQYEKYFAGQYQSEITDQQRASLLELLQVHNNLLETRLDKKFNWS